MRSNRMLIDICYALHYTEAITKSQRTNSLILSVYLQNQRICNAWKDKFMDLRTQKVYDSLISAFTQLLEEKPFEEITVNELCERAKTRRATFYKHFSDKYGFFQFLLKTMREKLLQDAENYPEQHSPQERLHAFVDLGIQFVEENKKFILSLKDSAVAAQMLQTITSESFHEHGQVFLLEDELAVQFLIGGLNQCVYWWLANIHRATTEEMRQNLYAIVDKYAEAID